MAYFRRDLEDKVLQASSSFKAVMVTGARRTGRTTMLKHLAQGGDRAVVTMDDLVLRNLARSEPRLFLQIYRPPVLISEIQKAPELLEAVAEICAATEEKGLFWLTGNLGRKIAGKTELLGRDLCVLNLYSLSTRERLGIRPGGELGLEPEDLKERKALFPRNEITAAFDGIWRGGYPEVQEMEPGELSAYFSTYVETFLLRDAVDDYGVSDTDGFRRFLRACAASAGQLVNYNDLGAASGVSGVTAKEWTKVLCSLGITFLLEPFTSERVKRLGKTPKLYFCDTGLRAYLSSWSGRDVLMNGAAAPGFFENHVIGELVRNYAYSEGETELCFYRDGKKREIGLIAERNGVLHPIEVRMTERPGQRDGKAFSLLREAGGETGRGAVICLTSQVAELPENAVMMPSNVI